ncbi:MAG: double zinc ribbon domain-containing protein [Oscillospiraceae bacterium]|jgi:ComF family protein|nr:double zinc ribbon domain-containing protein [Oscillospiraceae bacterium]
MRFLSFILDLLFPPKCVFCAKILNKGDDGWCDNCVESLPYADNYGVQSGEYFDFCVCALYYIENVRRSVLRYKFSGASHYADVYGRLLADCIREAPDIDYDILSWVPLSSKRERSRGYDQAMLLALATASKLNVTAVGTLKKPHDVQAQSELGDRTERSANISGAYTVSDLEIINGKRVLLIDDVITTGSTLDECANTLLTAGAAGVICAVLARGE